MNIFKSFIVSLFLFTIGANAIQYSLCRSCNNTLNCIGSNILDADVKCLPVPLDSSELFECAPFPDPCDTFADQYLTIKYNSNVKETEAYYSNGGCNALGSYVELVCNRCTQYSFVVDFEKRKSLPYFIKCNNSVTQSPSVSSTASSTTATTTKSSTTLEGEIPFFSSDSQNSSTSAGISQESISILEFLNSLQMVIVALNILISIPNLLQLI